MKLNQKNEKMTAVAAESIGSVAQLAINSLAISAHP